MAYTHIHNITSTLPKAIEYICDPAKTDEQLLVSGYNCEPYSAAFEFRATAALGREIKGDFTNCGGTENLAYHMIQSFSPYDNITPEEAHELGKRWADEITGGRYEYVIATHVDKGHIHNHIIFNATSFLDYSKFHNYKVAARLREVSDRLCIEKGLYVKPAKRKRKGMSHYEWAMRKAGRSWKAKLCDILNEAILQTSDWESFLQYIHEKGIDVKDGKRISFYLVGSGQGRYCRGDRLSDLYSRDGILDLLSKSVDEKKAVLSLSADIVSGAERFADTVEQAAQRTPYYNLQSLLDTLAVIKREEIAATSDFDKCIEIIDQDINTAAEKIAELKDLNSSYTRIAKFLVVYNKYKYLKEEAAQKPAFQRLRFEQIHAEEIEAFDYAAAQLEKNGIMTNADPEKVVQLAKQKIKNISDLDEHIDANTRRANQIRKARDITLQILAAAQQRQDQERRSRSPRANEER